MKKILFGFALSAETNCVLDLSHQQPTYALATQIHATFASSKNQSHTLDILDIDAMRKIQHQKVSIDLRQLLDLIHAARRYADFRCTYAAFSFNRLYDALIKEHPILAQMDILDETLMERGKYFPYAQDGNFNSESGAFDARPRHITNKL